MIRASKQTDRLQQLNCGPVQLAGASDALYERHLTFDHVTPLEQTSSRDRFEAIARSVRDLLSQRWLATEQTYHRANAKRIYYLSMEFLIGRTLANNITNLRLDSLWNQFCQAKGLDPLEIIEQERDAGLGNGGLGRLAACFLDSMATLSLPGMGYGLRYEYGIFRQSIRNGWQSEQPDHWLRRPDPWEVARPSESLPVQLACSFEVGAGSLRVVPGRPCTLIGIPYDRPIVGFGGKTVNTLRLWAAGTLESFDFSQFSSGDFVGALAESMTAETLTRVLYPDDSTAQGKGLRFLQEYFLVACSLQDLVRRFRAAGNDWAALPQKAAIQLNDTHPALAVSELMRILLDDAGLQWEQAWELCRETLAYTNHTLLPEALENWAKTWLLAFGLAIGQGVMQVALSLLILFFILKDGETLAMRLSRMVFRISGQRGVQLLDVAGGTVRGVIYGILGTALAQGVMAGVGFLVAGVPGATLLGLVTFLVSVVPMGPPLVWIPAAIWLFRQGQTGWGVFMLIWGAGVSSVDNVVKPWLISRGSKMPFIVIFFGVLGGALAFGLIGVFIGPTLLAVAYRLIDEWSGRQVVTDAPSPSAAAGPGRVG